MPKGEGVIKDSHKAMMMLDDGEGIMLFFR